MFQVSENWSDHDLMIVNRFGVRDFDITGFVREAAGLIPKYVR